MSEVISLSDCQPGDKVSLLTMAGKPFGIFTVGETDQGLVRLLDPIFDAALDVGAATKCKRLTPEEAGSGIAPGASFSLHVKAAASIAMSSVAAFLRYSELSQEDRVTVLRVAMLLSYQHAGNVIGCESHEIVND